MTQQISRVEENAASLNIPTHPIGPHKDQTLSFSVCRMLFRMPEDKVLHLLILTQNS